MRAVILTAGLALAATAGAAEPLLPLDRDEDGRITRKELINGNFFRRWDLDGDARLSAAEFRADGYLFTDWDADGDLRLTEDEFYRGLHRWLDWDRDGAVKDEELRPLAQSPWL